MLRNKLKNLFKAKQHYRIALKYRPEMFVRVTKNWAPWSPYCVVVSAPLTRNVPLAMSCRTLAEAKDLAHEWILPQGSGCEVDDTVVPL